MVDVKRYVNSESVLVQFFLSWLVAAAMLIGADLACCSQPRGLVRGLCGMVECYARLKRIQHVGCLTEGVRCGAVQCNVPA
jgi:hypothetical protein